MDNSLVTEFRKEGEKWRVLIHLSEDEILNGGLVDSLPFTEPQYTTNRINPTGRMGVSPTVIGGFR